MTALGSPCSFVNSGMYACNMLGMSLLFTQAGGVISAVLNVNMSGMEISYKATITDCMAPMTLTLQASPTPICDFPSTVSVKPVGGPVANIFTFTSCYPATTLGLAPSSNLGPSLAPFVGISTSDRSYSSTAIRPKYG